MRESFFYVSRGDATSDLGAGVDEVLFGRGDLLLKLLHRALGSLDDGGLHREREGVRSWGLEAG